MPSRSLSRAEDWPSLPPAAWDETRATLHMCTQIIGKIRLAQAPMTNHWWQVPLYVTSSGLTTSPIPHGARTFQIDLDFIEHSLRISVDDGRREGFALRPRSVADFYAQLMARMRSLGLEVRIWTMPCEIEHPIRFENDHRHASYDPDFVNRFWRVLVQTDRVLTACRARRRRLASARAERESRASCVRVRCRWHDARAAPRLECRRDSLGRDHAV